MYTTITTQDLLSEIQRSLIETVDGGTTWASGHWTVQEVYDTLYRRYLQFLKDTKLVSQTTDQVVVPHTPRQDLPDQWVLGLRIAWQPFGGSGFTELCRTDSFDIDNIAPTLGYQPEPTPRFYTEGEIPPPSVWLFPPPDNPGTLRMHYVGLSSTFTPASDTFTLPDDFIHYVKYGVMADMLSKVGRGQDLPRAGYCEQRYQEGVQIAQMLLGGS